MKRTAKRPIATGEISRRSGLVFATAISLLSLVMFYLFTTKLATFLTFLAIAFYVFGYTIALKKHTSQRTGNIIYSEITNVEKNIILYRYEYPNGTIAYFTREGKSIEKSLMRTPINGAKLSSRSDLEFIQY